jgi:hypothetical protein
MPSTRQRPRIALFAPAMLRIVLIVLVGDRRRNALRNAAAERLRKRASARWISTRARIDALGLVRGVVYRRPDRIAKAWRIVRIEVRAARRRAEIFLSNRAIGRLQHPDLRRNYPY